MAGSSGRTSGLQVKVRYSSTAPGTPSFDNLESLGSGNTEGEIPCVTDIGDIAREANTIEYSCYGEDTSRKIPGITSLGDFTFVIALDNSNALHRALMNKGIGSDMIIAIVTGAGTGGTAAGAGTADYIVGTLAGRTKSTPKDDVASVTFTIAMSQAPARYDHS